MDEKTPNYYGKDGIDPFHIMKIWSETDKEMSAYEGFLRFNVLKYIWRYRGKNGIDDLNKASHYLDLLKNEYLQQK